MAEIKLIRQGRLHFYFIHETNSLSLVKLAVMVTRSEACIREAVSCRTERERDNPHAKGRALDGKTFQSHPSLKGGLTDAEQQHFRT